MTYIMSCHVMSHMVTIDRYRISLLHSGSNKGSDNENNKKVTKLKSVSNNIGKRKRNSKKQSSTNNIDHRSNTNSNSDDSYTSSSGRSSNSNSNSNGNGVSDEKSELPNWCTRYNIVDFAERLPLTEQLTL
jgi:hypothetical protein